MGVPLNHPFQWDFLIFPYKPSSYWGTPIDGWKPPYNEFVTSAMFGMALAKSTWMRTSNGDDKD